ncbi:hypothetical protein QJS04_geneDACA006282 [Acorus gramineus]|uniref:P-type ATPase A domain-containing protein n=1 Tax=Acorus gramineus TaxID=55184 RepID=A0AAV9AVX1_ACOGR|nr:hypothetical protein QJS04_geneDACA006282 [Acorus gramineus]
MEVIPFSFGGGGGTIRLLSCKTKRHRRLISINPSPPSTPRTHLSVTPISPSTFIHNRPSLTRSISPLAAHNHHHDHHHHHHEELELNGPAEAIQRFARAVGWVQLADLLRENLRLCCCSLGLLLAAAACPCVLPKPSASLSQNALVFVAFPLVGVSAAYDAVIDIAAGKVNIHVLMALAAFASVFMGNSLEGGLLLAMFNLAHIAEEYFTSRAMVDVKELKDNNPDFALVLEDNSDGSPQFSELIYKKVPVHDLEVGLYILVKAGEVVPVDGEVYQGASTITIEHLTGEAKPLDIKAGDRVPGGARNLDGMMIIKATKTWNQSTLNRIMQLTEEGQLNKPKLQRWLDEFGEHYSKVVVGLSLAVAVIGPFVFKWPFIGTSVTRGSVYRALGLMVAASPCALAVAPLAYATAISACARKGKDLEYAPEKSKLKVLLMGAVVMIIISANLRRLGILLKGGHVLDALASCHTIAFDKTGTLTTGNLMCKAIEPIRGHRMGIPCCVPSCEKEALAVAAAMEKGTTHPIGRAVVEHSLGKDLPNIFLKSFESLPGRGLFATLTGPKSGTEEGELLKASLGSVDYIASLCNSNAESEYLKEAVKNSSYGCEYVHAALSIDKKVTLFHFEDEPRPSTADAISALRDQAKLRIMILTGDHASSAWRVANAVGIKEVYCDLKPEDKLNKVKSISRDTGGLIMVGDGINDAPALAVATVGIVLAQRASATAIAVADVLLLQDNISGVPYCVAKAHQTTLLVLCLGINVVHLTIKLDL